MRSKSSLRFIVIGIAFSMLFSTAILAQAELLDGLVMYLSFDELDGNAFSDLSGKGNDGVIEGSLDYVDGKFGKAIKNDGGVNFVRVAHDPSVNPVDNKSSVAAWIYLDDIDHSVIDWEHIILHWNDEPNEWTYHFALNFGKTSFIIADTNNSFTNCVGATLVSVGEWHHVTGVADGETIRVYLDGQEDGSLAYTTCNVVATDIGIANKTRGVFCGFNGIIDEAMIWNRPLSGDEVQEAMAGVGTTSVDSSWKLTTTWGDIKVD